MILRYFDSTYHLYENDLLGCDDLRAYTCGTWLEIRSLTHRSLITNCYLVNCRSHSVALIINGACPNLVSTVSIPSFQLDGAFSWFACSNGWKNYECTFNGLILMSSFSRFHLVRVHKRIEVERPYLPICNSSCHFHIQNVAVQSSSGRNSKIGTWYFKKGGCFARDFWN